jgi:isochorismate pyruvate lyase
MTRRFDTFNFASSPCHSWGMNSALKKTSIASLRQDIDVVDEKLIKLLAERQRLVEAIIAVKHTEGIPARVPARVDYVIDRARVLARAHHLDPALAESIWTEMVEWFVAHEERTLDMKK